MILSLDLSLRSSGIATIDEKGEIIFVSTIKTPINLRGVRRLDYVWLSISNYISQYKPEFIVLEDYAFSAHGSIPNLGELSGVVKYQLFKSNVPFFIISSTAIKKFVTGKGNSPKEAIMPAIYRKYKIEPKNSDEAVAIGLAKIAYAASLMKKEILNRDEYLEYEQNVLEALYDSENRESTYKLR